MKSFDGSENEVWFSVQGFKGVSVYKPRVSFAVICELWKTVMVFQISPRDLYSKEERILSDEFLKDNVK